VDYNSIIRDTLKVTPERARLVEAYLRLQYSTLDHLSRVDIRREYRSGGIGATIDADVEAAIRLADSYGCRS
jgi:GNAT superfamily N-acetyltransferase